MKIVVCVKEVPANVRALDAKTGRLDRSGDSRLNPRDLVAIEAALRAEADEVVLLSIGPAVEDSLREGLAMGADRAVLVADPALAGSDLRPTSLALARVLEREDPELTLFGQLAEDSTGGVLWSAVGALLRQPSLSQAVRLEIGDGVARVERQTEDGSETLESLLPCLVSVSDAMVEPRFPTFREMKSARDKPIDVLALEDIGMSPEEAGEAGSRTEVIAFTTVESERETIVLEGLAARDAGRAIADFLRERGLA